MKRPPPYSINFAKKQIIISTYYYSKTHKGHYHYLLEQDLKLFYTFCLYRKRIPSGNESYKENCSSDLQSTVGKKKLLLMAQLCLCALSGGITRFFCNLYKKFVSPYQTCLPYVI